MADEPTILYPAAYGHALVTLDQHYAAAKALSAAIDAINEAKRLLALAGGQPLPAQGVQ